MLDLPKSCLVKQIIPKKKFYEKVGVSSGVKNEFVNIIDRITWLYKLSPDTIGITKTENVEEIQVFQIDVKEKKVPMSVIRTITKGVQYEILFLIKYNEDFCYSIKVEDNFYSSEWNDEINFDFNSINLEIVYKNIVKSIIKEENNTKQFEEIIGDRNIKTDLEKRINQLKRKIKNEKQFNKKTGLNIKLNELIKEMGDLNNE